MPVSPNRLGPGRLALLLFAYLGVALLFERHTDRAGELVLGGVTWGVLWAACRPLDGAIRARVAGVVLVASAGEVLGSLVLGLYAYRRGGIPLFVPPGHGLVYLAGHHLARTRLLWRRPSRTVWTAGAAGAAWALLGLVGATRPDVAGALAMGAFLAFLWRGPEPVLFAAMLVVVAALELYGTQMGSWTWIPEWPGGVPAGNPPSGVVAGYCAFDAAALRLAPWLCGLAVRAQASSRAIAPGSSCSPATRSSTAGARSGSMSHWSIRPTISASWTEPTWRACSEVQLSALTPRSPGIRSARPRSRRRTARAAPGRAPLGRTPRRWPSRAGARR
jgi:hypothetical protein